MVKAIKGLNQMIFNRENQPEIECNCWAIHAHKASKEQIPFVMQVVFNEEWGNIECRHDPLSPYVFGLNEFLWGDMVETPTVETESSRWAQPALMPYEPTEKMLLAAKNIDPALRTGDIKSLWCTMWGVYFDKPTKMS